MGSSRQSVPEQRRSLRGQLIVQFLLLCSLGISLAQRIGDGDWLPWGVAILIVMLASVSLAVMIIYRLRRLLGSGESRQVDHQSD